MPLPAGADQIYTDVIKLMPVPERLKLATLILNNIPQEAVVDYSEEWSEVDVVEFTASSWRLIDQRLEEEGDFA